MAVSNQKRQRWLLVSNCQVLGLGNCLNLLSDQVEVEHYDPVAFRNQGDALLERIDDFERVLVAPQIEANLAIDEQRCRALWRVPTISFNAYHPDLCYLLEDAKPLKGPLGDYHSLITYVAFRHGFSPQRTLSLFCGDIYARLGYFDHWDGERDRLLQTFRDSGFPLDATFAQWSRNGPFMYSINHPRIHCIRDVARSILQRAGLDAVYEDALPNDNLANGPIFPVYPEIGSTLGVSGSYLFKRHGQYGFLRLQEWISESFKLYAGRELTVFPMFRAAFDKALPILEAAA